MSRKSTAEDRSDTMDEETDAATCCFGKIPRGKGVKILAGGSIGFALINMAFTGWWCILAVLAAIAAIVGVFTKYRTNLALMVWETLTLFNGFLHVISVCFCDGGGGAFAVVILSFVNLYFVYIIDEWRKSINGDVDQVDERKETVDDTAISVELE